MEAERWQRVETLYHSALRIPADQRVAFLEDSCAGDASLREEVESLLARHTAAQNFMETPAFEVAAKEMARQAMGLKLPGPGTDRDQGTLGVAAARVRAAEEEFVPGNVLAERYRIVTVLGRGGMGAVYRADDLTLGHVVALKFLPTVYAREARRLELFRAEVRHSRQISHPSVCRVYDIHEANGLHFLAMEYIDGEDLRSLLRRIGRLPQDKALQIARQLCAGLAAAHAKGVLHRDLKPANIMIDGQGHVRITDFGLAVHSDDERELRKTAGTPAYMAPEQLAGKPATVQSDLYSLGLVLYELYTGKGAFDTGSLEEWKHSISRLGPVPPSARVGEVDGNVERAILQCLEQDPDKRPSSALKVAAALPGGDLLAETVAAGETPSPEMVAAAEEPALRVGTAWAALIGTLVLLVALALIANRSTIQGMVSVGQERSVLTAEAQNVIRRAGYTGPFNDSAADVGYFWPFVAYWVVKEPHNLPVALNRYPGPMFFWYRTSIHAIQPVAPGANVDYNRPPLVRGSAIVWLTSEGKLWSFHGLPTRPGLEAPSANKQVDWSAVFDQAGLPMSAFHEVPANLIPYNPYDSRTEWEGTVDNATFHVYAASLNGRMVFFAIQNPYTLTDLGENMNLFFNYFWVVWSLEVALMTLIGGFFAYRNVRGRRVDRKGARWVFLCIFIASLFQYLGIQHFTANLGDLADEFGNTIFEGIGSSLLLGVVGCVGYLAVEPFTRRHSPHLLISWSRIVAGNFLNPIVGRDLLLGVLTGCIAGLGVHMIHLLAPWAAPLENHYPLFSTAGTKVAIGQLGFELRVVFITALLVMFFLVVLQRLLRREWIAIVVTSIMVGVTTPPVEIGVWWLIYAGMCGAGLICVLAGARLGLLGLIVALFVERVFVFLFTAVRWSDWNVARPLLLLGFFAALAIYGFRIAVARPLLTTALDE